MWLDFILVVGLILAFIILLISNPGLFHKKTQMKPVRTFEAQVITCRTRWFSLAVDDRIVRVKYGFNSASSIPKDAKVPYMAEPDLTLNLEYEPKGISMKPVQKEILEALERYDNVIVEEYQKGIIFKKISHKIIFVQRGDEILYSAKDGTGMKNPTAIKRKQEWTNRVIEQLAPYIERYLKNTKFEDPAIITDKKKYMRYVVDTAWELLPFLNKLMGRKEVEWDTLFMKLREEAFIIMGKEVKINEKVYARIPGLMKKILEGKVE